MTQGIVQNWNKLKYNTTQFKSLLRHELHQLTLTQHLNGNVCTLNTLNATN